ncbi:MAG TPA: sigma-54-dependent Fis family transcriptional regulator [Desulfonauticus sp.]|nr:MAG: Two component, sigma54 specific, transcriptional regulator, Fis family [Desulfonauticus sp. 38_4375]HCO12233.1 sigma-54-dependent Fis family transcriptional regulator [Desulfonauticus sp.]
MKNLNVLILDKDPYFLETLSKRLALRKFQPFSSQSFSSALSLLNSQQFVLLLLDTEFLSSQDDFNSLQQIVVTHPYLKIALLTGKNKENFSNPLKLPTFPKEDLRDFWEFLRSFQPINIEEKSTEAETPSSRIPWIIGETPQIQELKKKLNKIAVLDCPVLIIGETGTGKELIAKTIHRLSFRSKEKFIAIHCSTFNPEILFREIFGEEYQYSNQQTRKRKGLLEAVNNGTLFLHEIEESPLMIQSMLLKFIEHKIFIPYGGNEEIKADARIIAATNSNLQEKIKAGKFREDLYYRLNAVSLELPPLRKRKDDIPLLAYYFLNKYSKEFKKNITKISAQALYKLKEYDFPGNVRELEYLIERAVILAEGEEIDTIHFPSRFKSAMTSFRVDNFKPLAEIEKEYILRVLNYTKGNKVEAAKILGISRTSLWRKLKNYNLPE